MRTSTKVIIIGAGPTGLMAACQLARFNVEFIIIDKKSGPTAESRAMIVTPRSMEIYQQMGLADALLVKSKTIPDLSIFIDGREKASFNLAGAGNAISHFPAFQAFEQFKNEKLLYDSLTAGGHEVIWETEFQSLEQHGNMVTVETLRSIGGTTKPSTFHAEYLLACDGSSSPVRHALKLKFAGGTYQNKFFVADAKINWQQSSKRLIATPGRNNFCAFFPMYGDSSYRILGTLPKSYKNRTVTKFNDLRPVVHAAAKIPMQIEQVNWFSIYQLHHRCINQFRVKNCFLLGDAAHIHSPAGGQGMNTGLQDAHNLAWKLALVASGKAGDGLLDFYHEERFPFAKWLLKFTDRVFAFMTGENLIRHAIRKYLLPIALNHFANLAPVQKRIFMVLSQLGYRYKKNAERGSLHTRQEIKFRPGDRCPFVYTMDADMLQNNYQFLDVPQFVLFVIGDFANGPEPVIPEGWKKTVKVVHLGLNIQWKNLGVMQPLILLIRPDQFIAMIADHNGAEHISNYFDSLI